LVDLCKRIIEEADTEAIREFHDHRRPFRAQSGQELSFIGFLDLLCGTPYARRLANDGRQVVERAHDLTVDKFTALPSRTKEGEHAKSNGVDCRYYFRAFVEQMRKWSEVHGNATPLQCEIAAATHLQRFVVRQFRNSCLEARRHGNPARTRYAWRVGGQSIYVWMPTSLSGHARRHWLEANIDDPDATRAGERERIQATIDHRLGVPRHVPLEDDISCGVNPRRTGLGTPPLDEQIRTEGLAATVAQEKVENIEKQRPAIRALGGDSLQRLIRRIFQELSEERYEEQALARAFGLSKATLSRFAGSRWRLGRSGRVPDLWLNVAQTLAGHSRFVELARDAGVWDRVEALLTRSILAGTEAGQ